MSDSIKTKDFLQGEKRNIEKESWSKKKDQNHVFFNSGLKVKQKIGKINIKELKRTQTN